MKLYISLNKKVLAGKIIFYVNPENAEIKELADSKTDYIKFLELPNGHGFPPHSIAVCDGNKHLHLDMANVLRKQFNVPMLYSELPNTDSEASLFLFAKNPAKSSGWIEGSGNSVSGEKGLPISRIPNKNIRGFMEVYKNMYTGEFVEDDNTHSAQIDAGEKLLIAAKESKFSDVGLAKALVAYLSTDNVSGKTVAKFTKALPSSIIQKVFNIVFVDTLQAPFRKEFWELLSFSELFSHGSKYLQEAAAVAAEKNINISDFIVSRIKNGSLLSDFDTEQFKATVRISLKNGDFSKAQICRHLHWLFVPGVCGVAITPQTPISPDIKDRVKKIVFDSSRVPNPLTLDPGFESFGIFTASFAEFGNTMVKYFEFQTPYAVEDWSPAITNGFLLKVSNIVRALFRNNLWQFNLVCFSGNSSDIHKNLPFYKIVDTTSTTSKDKFVLSFKNASDVEFCKKSYEQLKKLLRSATVYAARFAKRDDFEQLSQDFFDNEVEEAQMSFWRGDENLVWFLNPRVFRDLDSSVGFDLDVNGNTVGLVLQQSNIDSIALAFYNNLIELCSGEISLEKNGKIVA